jgi:hypothetical protein
MGPPGTIRDNSLRPPLASMHALFRESGVVASRWRTAAWHLAISTLLVGLVTIGLVMLWYPPPYADLSGGLDLLRLLVGVDIVLGPLLTFVVAKPGKPIRLLARDLAVILVAQLAALAFGLYTLAIARPIGLVWEVDQFRVVAAADVHTAGLAAAAPSLRTLSWSGPRVFAAVKPSDPDELLQAIQLGMAGVELSAQPKYWRTYDTQRAAVLQRAVGVDALLAARPAAAAPLDALLREVGLPREAVRIVPLVARRAGDWCTVIGASDARVIGYLPFEAPRR